ncbi:MAG: flagellar type III secretion system pore protein FliP [Myxococcales bacterium]|nr:flagellar type III secretion system pore protein FliP [Myxococcales bacterium]
MTWAVAADLLAPLLLTLGGLGLLRVLLSRLRGDRGRGVPRDIAVLETRALSPKHHLHLVAVRGETLLLATTEEGVALLRTHPEEASEGDGPASASDAEAPRSALRLLRPLALSLAAIAACVLLASGAGAETISIQIGGEDAVSPDGLSATMQTLIFLTLVTIAPSLVLMATCFTRIVIVLALLRQAIGVQQLPPNQILIALALFTTFYVMSPVAEAVRADAYAPYVAGTIEADEALERGMAPIRHFLSNYTRESDLALFQRHTANDTSPSDESTDAIPITQLLPAYMMSELRTAFEIGFTIYLPFLVIDLVIASMLISMGMIVLPPIVISLPFKLMLFVLLDGWNLIIGSLVSGLTSG